MVFALVEPVGAWTAAGEVVLKHAEASPSVVFPLLSLLGVFSMIAGFAYVYVRFYLPTYKEQKGLDREHLAGLVAQRGREAQEDVAAARELAKAQQSAIVEKIGSEVSRQTGEIAKLHDKTDRHGELLRSVAAKVGVGLLILILAGLGIMEGQRYVAKLSDAPITCDPPCSSGQRCTRDGCKEIKTGTASASKSPPHSALRVRGFANLASGSCLQERTFCP